LFMNASTPVYSVATVGASNGAFLASVPPAGTPVAFRPNGVAPMPGIVRVEPGTDIQPGMTLRITGTNFGSDATLFLAGQTLNPQQVAEDQYTVVVPPIEAGSANLVVRRNGLESAPIVMHVLLPDGSPTQTVSGQALYQKIDVTDAGLDLN